VIIEKTKIFFNSSMPRSGSTLLQNILGNNPDIYATPTSGLLPVISACKEVYTNSQFFRALDPVQMKSGFTSLCRGAMEGYFSGLTDRKYAVDKNRGWAVNRGFLETLYPDPKILFMVRDLREIAGSMEKIDISNPERFNPSKDGPKYRGITAMERVAGWFQTQPLGVTLQMLFESIRSGHASKFLFIRFEDLCANPEREMKRVYGYLGIPYCPVDYKNIKQVTHEDDRIQGQYAEHDIRPSVEIPTPRAKELLGDQVCDTIVNRHQWYFSYFKYAK